MKSKSAINNFLPLFEAPSRLRSEAEVLADVRRLHSMWRDGLLGGELMPEDVHPSIPKDSDELATYFTFGMCLNYQRNSYSLWRACTAAFDDSDRNWVFNPSRVVNASEQDLADALLYHKVALQPSRHPAIWRRNAEGFFKYSNGSVLKLFEMHGFDIVKLKSFFRDNSQDFPYLCGPKISNYWLFVMTQYMSWPITSRNHLTVAPDTHVISASFRLGLLTEAERSNSSLPNLVANRWHELLANTDLVPIDLHTPLWLWSRAGFPQILNR